MRRPSRGGGRVFLRPPRATDRDEVLRLNRASGRFNRGLATPPVTPGQFERYMARRRRPDCPGFLICRVADGTVVGSINISEIVRGSVQSAYLGYQVGAPFARQGDMTESLALALRVAFERLRLHPVEANIQPGNRPSLVLVRRAGLRREGLSRRYLRGSGTRV